MTASTPMPAASPVPTAPAIPDVVFEHLEELAFLMVQRRRLVFSPDAPAEALARLDARVAAHRDGLAVAGPAAVRLAIEALGGSDPWLVAAAARTWLELGSPATAEVLERLEAAGELLPAWREALRAVETPVLDRLFPATAPLPATPAAAEAVADARLWRGALAAPALQAAARSEHAGVRRAVARLARDGALLATFADDADAGVRERALWSAAIANPKSAASLARTRLAGETPPAIALRVLGLFGERADGDRLAALLAHPELATTAILALRDLAIPAHARHLLPLLAAKDEDVAALATEAFESLLGPVPPPDDEHPLPGGLAAADAHFQRVGAKAGESERRLQGVPLAWPGPPELEPLERRWRAALLSPSGDPALRREAPDGFFDGSAAHEARAGA